MGEWFPPVCTGSNGDYEFIDQRDAARALARSGPRSTGRQLMADRNLGSDPTLAGAFAWENAEFMPGRVPDLAVHKTVNDLFLMVNINVSAIGNSGAAVGGALCTFCYLLIQKTLRWQKLFGQVCLCLSPTCKSSFPRHRLGRFCVERMSSMASEMRMHFYSWLDHTVSAIGRNSNVASL